MMMSVVSSPATINALTSRKSWPWCNEDEVYPRLENWPRITIITPSFNQGQYLEETILSVIHQGYPNLEYMVIDGGSKDQSVDIVRRYQSKINYWVSEPDRGQSHAINKGFNRCTGEIVGWINSDDLLLPGALKKLAVEYKTSPNAILLGDVINFISGENSSKLIQQKKVSFKNLVVLDKGMVWQQPGTFVPVQYLHSEGLLDETLRYVFDRDWMCRLLKKYDIVYLHKPVAMFRLHPLSKTVGEKYLWLPEQELISKRYWDEIPGLNKNIILSRFALERAAIQLGARNWNRSMGKTHLRNSLRMYPLTFFSFQFIELLGRSILPYSCLMKIRDCVAKIKPSIKN
jgi:glycosyltransferase involved in cell wall biosynthesis